LSGGFDGVEVEVGEGSTQINPNHSEEVQEWLLKVPVAVGVGIVGGDVIGCDLVVVVLLLS
jgi:hypothetical protein